MIIDNANIFEKYLDYGSVKQKLISKNIANIGTLNYQREDIAFEEFLKKETQSELKITDGRQIQFSLNSGIDPSSQGIVKDTNPELESNFNNIDVDKEMADMAQNSIMFRFASRKIGNYYKNLQSLISKVR
ncbi:MAG: flagellar basal body rod protein FlgB [bacterium]